MIEAPDVPLHMIKENMDKELQDCFEAPSTPWGPLVTDICPVTTTLPPALGSKYRLVRLRHVCYVTPKSI